MLKDVIFVWLEKIFYFFIFLSQVSQNTHNRNGLQSFQAFAFKTVNFQSFFCSIKSQLEGLCLALTVQKVATQYNEVKIAIMPPLPEWGSKKVLLWVWELVTSMVELE